MFFTEWDVPEGKPRSVGVARSAVKDGGVEMNTRGATALHCFSLYLPPECVGKDGTTGKYNPIDFACELEHLKEKWMNAFQSVCSLTTNRRPRPYCGDMLINVREVTFNLSTVKRLFKVKKNTEKLYKNTVIALKSEWALRL